MGSIADVSAYRTALWQVRYRTRPSPLIATPISGSVATIGGPLVLNQRKERSTVGPYAPNPPGYTRATKVGTMGSDPERGRQSRNPIVVRTEGCNSPSPRWLPE